jgi:alpha-beta hydrolase superfamily lysophospholipase
MSRYALFVLRQKNDRVVVVCPGRIESYVKYAELAYDLFHSGFDVLIIDHRGQGRPGVCCGHHRGHVVAFSDYVDDLAAFWQQEVPPALAKAVYSCALNGRRDCDAVFAAPPTAVRCHCALRADVRHRDAFPGLDGAPYSRLG